MSLSPIAMEKRREEYVERSGSAAAGVWGAGSHSSANMYSQDTVKQSTWCLATTVTCRPNCQMGLPGHRDTAVFSTLPFYFLSSLATSDRHKTRVPFLPLTAKLEEKAPSTLHGQL